MPTPAERERAQACLAAARASVAAARALSAADVAIPAALWQAIELELATLELMLPPDPWPPR